MKTWLRFLGEKKISITLYLVTVFLFLLVGDLYHIENFPKLLYAALLTLVIWGALGIWRGIAYVEGCRRLRAAARHYEQSAELVAEELKEAGDTLWNELVDLLELVCSTWQAERGEWEAKTADCNDYYMMWTHQIKTPIAAMKLLLENGGERDRDSFILREELFKIEQYVEMALTFQRLESLSSDLVLRECDLYALLKQTVRKFSVLFINKGLGLELQENQLRVLTDEKWFGFCIGQLISNSLKYTKQGHISIRAAKEEDRVLLRLEDTGIGIYPEDLPRIFERGFTGYNGRMDEKSTGIGLYLCRRVFDHLGITVKVESRVGEGTTILLGIPVPGNRVPDLTEM